MNDLLRLSRALLVGLITWVGLMFTQSCSTPWDDPFMGEHYRWNAATKKFDKQPDPSEWELMWKWVRR